MTRDVPTWRDLDSLISRNGLSEQGVETVRRVLGTLQSILGESWLARQYRKQGRLPGELLLAGTYRVALQQALWFILRLEQAIAEPTFAPVRTALARGVDNSTWRHTLLQLQVARAAADRSAPVLFEPSIPHSTKKGDLLVHDAAGSIWMVETTTIPRAARDMTWQDYEDWLRSYVRQVEHRHNVSCTVELADHMAEDETRRWFNEVEIAAASTVDATEPQVVASDIGTITIHVDTPPKGTVRFSGAVQYRDGWHRLGRTLSDKSKQIVAPWPAWIRVDCLDGLFQFTEWATMPSQERFAIIAAQIRESVEWPLNAEGVVLSSGPA